MSVQAGVLVGRTAVLPSARIAIVVGFSSKEAALGTGPAATDIVPIDGRCLEWTLMGQVIFMCGPAGSGKSTVARRYEQEGMTRLSFDQEAWARGISTMPLPPDVHRDIEDVLRARLVELVRAGTGVVVDFSFWSRAMREEYRELLRPLGVVPKTVYLATDRATVLQRVAVRAAADGDDFAISTELAAFYFDHFEPPTAEEGPLTIIGHA
jgi:predicted kinase